MVVKTKEQLSEKQAAGYFWKLLELNAFPIITWELNGKITHANDAFLEMLGYTRREFDEGRINWKEITPSEFAHLDEQCIQQLKAHAIAKPFEKKYKKKDGTLIRVRLFNAMLGPSESHGVGIIIPIK